MQLKSAAFDNNHPIPKAYTGDGADRSPELGWLNPPSEAKEFALICDDPDAPAGTWVHWVLWGIGADTRELKEGVPAQQELPGGMRQGTNDFRKPGYGGPMPPRGSDHRYYFRLYALDAPLDVKPGAAKKDIVRAMQGHILAETALMGRYKR